jgi:hypothetical protein
MLHGWENFFWMLGSASGGLIGLLFVVVTLTSESDRDRVMRGISIYLSPITLNFAVILSVSALALAPRIPVQGMTLVLALATLGGSVSAIRALVRMSNPPVDGEPPDRSDFWFYGVAPTVVYAGLAGAVVAFGLQRDWAVNAIALALLSLMLLGIRNAWDLVTWMAPQRRRPTPSTDALGAVAGDQAGANGVAIDGGERDTG